MVQTGIEKAAGGNNEKDEKKVVAGGIAITVVIILMIAWGYFFIQKIRNNSQQMQIDSGAQNDFNPTSVREAQQMINNRGAESNQDLQDLRNQNNSSGAVQQQTVMQVGESDTNQFINPNGI